MIHAHLTHNNLVLGRCRQDGKRHTNKIIKVSLRCVHPIARGKCLRTEVFCSSFAARTGNANYNPMHVLSAPPVSKTQQKRLRIVVLCTKKYAAVLLGRANKVVRCILCKTNARSTCFESTHRIGVAISVLAGKGHKHAAFLHTSRVDNHVHGTKRGCFARRQWSYNLRRCCAAYVLYGC